MKLLQTWQKKFLFRYQIYILWMVQKDQLIQMLISTGMLCDLFWYDLIIYHMIIWIEINWVCFILIILKFINLLLSWSILIRNSQIFQPINPSIPLSAFLIFFYFSSLYKHCYLISFLFYFFSHLFFFKIF